MAHLSISLLGTYRVTLDGTPVTAFESDKVRGLLAYLAVEREHPHRREALATLFWPNTSDARARQNLRRALYDLRQNLEPDDPEIPHLQATRQALQLNQGSDHWLDVAAFSTLLAATQSHPHARLDSCPSCIAFLGEAIDLYRGDFLAGICVPESEPFEDWRRFNQEAFHGQVMGALVEVANYHERRRDYASAAHYLRQQIELEPWHEAAHRQLMLVLALKGDRSAALLQYDTCRSILLEELGVEPTLETTLLRDRIQAEEHALERIETENPYKGLRAFDESDAAEFFGRESFVERLLDTVRVQETSVIIGASGSGKSSVLQAGLLPQLRSSEVTARRDAGSRSHEQQIGLRAGPGVERVREGEWLTVSLRPGDRPFEQLAGALLPQLEPESDADQPAFETSVHSMASQLRTGELNLADLAQRIRGRAGQHDPTKCRLLLILDQLEQLFSDCPDPDVRRSFIDCILPPGDTGQSRESCPVPYRLLISLRADFVAQSLAHRQLAQAIQEGGLVLGPMTRDELRRAVEEPARSRGMVFEPGLLERLLHEAGDDAGNLPLLQLTLTLLWDQQMRGQLTHAAYAAIGGLDGAITSYADSVYEGLGLEERRGARHVLTQLVRLGQATQDTRRLATRAELSDDWHLVQKLADARLIVTDRDSTDQETAELVHDALIHHWGLLRSWMEADRAFHTWRQGLRATRERWAASGRDEGAVLRGVALVEAEEWTADRAAELPLQELEFIEASLSLRDRQQAENAERRRQELVRARALAEAEHERAHVEARARRRMRWTAIGYALVFVLALGAAFWARIQLQTASEAQAVAKSLSLAADALVALDENDTDLALALSMEANRLPDPPPQAMLALAKAAAAPGTRRIFAGHEGPVLDLAVSADGRQAISASADQTLILWDLAHGEEVRRLTAHSDEVEAVALDPEGRRALSGGADGSLILWDLETGQVLSRLSGHTDGVHAVKIGPDGKTALSASEDGSLILWDLATGEAVHRISEDAAPFRSAAISPDGQTSLAGTLSGSVLLLDTKTGEVLRRFVPAGANGQARQSSAGDQTGGTGALYSPDGTRAIALADAQVTLWDLSSGELIERLTLSDMDPLSIDVSPDGHSILLGTVDGRLVLVDLTTGARTRELSGHEHGVWAVGFTPDGHRALSGTSHGGLRLWDLHAATAEAHGSTALSAAAGGSGEENLVDLTQDSLVDWIDENREVPLLTCQQRVHYGIAPYCDGTGRPPSDDD